MELFIAADRGGIETHARTLIAERCHCANCVRRLARRGLGNGSIKQVSKFFYTEEEGRTIESTE